jgi:glycosyltransferase involved in cell wall biosynthesis
VIRLSNTSSILNREGELSIVIPAKNESKGLAQLLPTLCESYGHCEIIIVDDGSDDDTAEVARAHGAKVVVHPYSKGNGAAIKSGARAAAGNYILFMDGDGQHRVEDIAGLLAKVDEGYDLVVGARQGINDQASVMRWGANSIYNRLSSWMVGQPIDDLTSGMRVVRRDRFMEFLYLLPNGFSYPTTSTMAFFRAGYSVGFVPIQVEKRIGSSHMRLVRDGIRFFLIIFKIGTLYSPLKIYFPAAVLLAGGGLANYLYTLMSSGRFTNMSAMLFISALTVFLIGLMSEQITNLMYQKTS